MYAIVKLAFPYFILMQILTDHKDEVWFVQFSNNGEYMASSSKDCSAMIWKVRHFFVLLFPPYNYSTRLLCSVIAIEEFAVSLITHFISALTQKSTCDILWYFMRLALKLLNSFI